MTPLTETQPADRRCRRTGRLASSPPSPVTAEGVTRAMAPDGRTRLLTLADGAFQMGSTEPGPARPVGAPRQGDRLVGSSRDSKAAYVQRGSEVPAVIERVDLIGGARRVTA
jgi:hypothetical protein